MISDKDLSSSEWLEHLATEAVEDLLPLTAMRLKSIASEIKSLKKRQARLEEALSRIVCKIPHEEDCWCAHCQAHSVLRGE